MLQGRSSHSISRLLEADILPLFHKNWRLAQRVHHFTVEYKEISPINEDSVTRFGNRFEFFANIFRIILV